MVARYEDSKPTAVQRIEGVGKPQCRFCQSPLEHLLVDLGATPFANSYLQAPNGAEHFYPLRAYICDSCFLVQLEAYESPDSIFTDYAYFSSYSESWLKHAHGYVKVAVERFGLDQRSLVVELASNDGYLLQYFVDQGIPVLGVEPAGNVAEVAIQKGIPTRVEFFGRETARCMVTEGLEADLLIGNNVLAHVPDLNDFVAGMKILLKPTGVITVEFPHLLQLISNNQFDTIYHEHFSYFSFSTAQRIFAAHGLTIFDVDELPTHGGSLRIYACHSGPEELATSQRVPALIEREDAAGLNSLARYRSFAEHVMTTKQRIRAFLAEVKQQGKTIAGYGAPAKGNTLLNYCGVGTDVIDYTVDRSPVKQGRFLPGTHIPIFHPDKIRETKPDYVLILPWNLQQEIMQQMACIREWRGQFVVFIPEIEIIRPGQE